MKKLIIGIASMVLSTSSLAAGIEEGQIMLNSGAVQWNSNAVISGNTTPEVNLNMKNLVNTFDLKATSKGSFATSYVGATQEVAKSSVKQGNANAKVSYNRGLNDLRVDMTNAVNVSILNASSRPCNSDCFGYRESSINSSQNVVLSSVDQWNNKASVSGNFVRGDLTLNMTNVVNSVDSRARTVGGFSNIVANQSVRHSGIVQGNDWASVGPNRVSGGDIGINMSNIINSEVSNAVSFPCGGCNGAFGNSFVLSNQSVVGSSIHQTNVGAMINHNTANWDPRINMTNSINSASVVAR